MVFSLYFFFRFRWDWAFFACLLPFGSYFYTIFPYPLLVFLLTYLSYFTDFRNSSCILDCSLLLVTCISKIFPNFDLSFKFLNRNFVRHRVYIFMSLNLTIFLWPLLRVTWTYSATFFLNIWRIPLSSTDLHPPEIYFLSLVT